MSYTKNPNYEFEGWVRTNPKRKFHYFPEDDSYSKCGSASRYAYASSNVSDKWEQSSTVPMSACRTCTNITGQVNLDALAKAEAAAESNGSLIRLMHGSGNMTSISVGDDSVTFQGKRFERQGEIFVEEGWNAILETLTISTTEPDKGMVQILAQGMANQFVSLRKVIATTLQVIVVAVDGVTEISASGLRLEQKNEE